MSCFLNRRGAAGAALMIVAASLQLVSCSDGDTITNVTNVTGVSIYGDGSAGARTVSANETLTDENMQYTNFTVDVGAILTVASGTVIRCTGTFTNNGTITVQTGARGATQTGFNPVEEGTYAPAEAGVSLRAATNGEYGSAGTTRAGGQRGVGLSAEQARTILFPGVKAGGGAGGSFSAEGPSGGGSLVIRAAAGFTNAGSIEANGAVRSTRGGGGGGGIVIVASAGAIDNGGGTITADGGNGGNNDTFAGAGGGGGGGIIHFLSKNVTMGTTSVAAGTGGSGGSVTADPHQGGGGGGACGGSGGFGGSVSGTGTAGTAGDGVPGYVLVTDANPAALFLAHSSR